MSSTRPRLRRTVVASLTALVLVVGGALAVATPAAAANGVVTGTLSVNGGTTTRAGALVEAFSTTGPGYQATTTDASGDWTMSLPEDSYQFRFSGFVSEVIGWYGGPSTLVFTRTEALVVGVSPAGAIVNGAIYSVGFASGTSTPGTMVTAFRLNTVLDKYEAYGNPDTTDSGGNWSVYVAPGSYIFRFGPQPGNSDFETKYLGALGPGDSGATTYIAETNPLSGASGAIGIASGPILGFDQFVTRLSGANRFETSAAIALQAFGVGGANVAFIVNGRNFPDALSAGPAAGLVDAPVLLTEPSALPEVIGNALDTLGVTSIVIVGGLPSVSQAVEDHLTAIVGPANVLRIAGSNRYETSRLVAETFFGGATVAYVATGTGFPDALAAGPAAANDLGPVILVPGTSSSVDTPTADLIANLGVKTVVIAGGAPSVSAGMRASLLALPSVTSIFRAGGSNRYETGVLLNEGSFELTDTVYLATGGNFPDALSGAAAASSTFYQGPIYLVPQNCVPASVLSAIATYQPKDIFLLGGEPSLSAAVESLTPC